MSLAGCGRQPLLLGFTSTPHPVKMTLGEGFDVNRRTGTQTITVIPAHTAP